MAAEFFPPAFTRRFITRALIGVPVAATLLRPPRALAAKTWTLSPKPSDIITERHCSQGGLFWQQVLPAGGSGVLLGLTQRSINKQILATIGTDGTVRQFSPHSAALPSPEALTPTAMTATDAAKRLAVLMQRDAEAWYVVMLDAATLSVTSTTRIPPGLTTSSSRFAAIACHGQNLYLADEGDPAILAFDIEKRQGSRFLAHDPSLRGRRAIVVDGEPKLKNGRPIEQDVSIAALSPDGAWLYYQPACGPLYRIGTALLTDPDVDPVQQFDGIVNWENTPTLGGIAVTSDNSLIMTDIAHGRLLRFGPERQREILMQSPRLTSASAPAIAPDNTILVPLSDGPTILQISNPPR